MSEITEEHLLNQAKQVLKERAIAQWKQTDEYKNRRDHTGKELIQEWKQEKIGN